MDLNAGLDHPGMPPVLGLLVMLLGVYVSLDMGQRVRRRNSGERLAWLLAAALALSTGLWAAAVLGVAELRAGSDFAFDARVAGAAALGALVLGLLGLHWSQSPTASSAQRLAGAMSLGAAAVAAPLLMLHATAPASGLGRTPGLLLLAWLCAGSAFGWGLVIARSPIDRDAGAPRHALSASIIGAGVIAAQWLALAAAGLPDGGTPADADSVSAGTLVMLASLGGAELLLLMLLACAIESRLRRRLDNARRELEVHATRDELTSLPNRPAFESMLAQTQIEADAEHGQVALLLVALDGFKYVNEAFNHQFGDRLLQHVAQRLRGMVPPQAVARLGGDEFLMLIHGPQATAQAIALAAQVIDVVAQPCNLEGRDVAIGCSVGLACYPQHGSMSALITHAGTAMRAAKSAGGATYSIFDPRMVIDVREQAEMLRDLRMALSRGQLELYYQPKIHAPSAQITGVEALLRWHHPQRGTISPTVFIPMAERNGLINSLGAWVIDEACRQARVWRDQGLRMRVAINLSAHQLRQRDLPQRVAAALARHQINPDLLTCEITESVAMEDTEATLRFFSELDAVGVHISIDDFGSGYSSLAYLRKLPAGELKIDRSFVLDLASSEEARKIAAAVVQLAQALKLKVVAEGVETDAQYQILRQLGCDELQGFLFAKPMSAKALGLWAMADEGPRAIQFSESLFQNTCTADL